MPSSFSRRSAVRNRALAQIRLAGYRRIGRVELAVVVVEEVEDQRLQHLQRRRPHGSAVAVLAFGLAVEVAGAVPNPRRGLLRQGLEFDFLGRAV